jgi:Flp pilus assembly protein TadD
VTFGRKAGYKKGTMAEPAFIQLTLATDNFDVSVLPLDARQRGSAAFREAATAYLSAEFQRFGGSVSVEINGDLIEATWTTDSLPAAALAQIAEKLKHGEYPRAITLLRLLLSGFPNDANLLYNLGMALSDTGKLHEAMEHLRRAVTIAPDFTNARVALGIALQRHGEDSDALRILNEAVTRDPENAWAQRNLGACLLNGGAVNEAEACLRRATLLEPRDQLAMFGLAEALAKLERLAEADDAYQKAIDVNPSSRIAEFAQQERRRIASRQARKP